MKYTIRFFAFLLLALFVTANIYAQSKTTDSTKKKGHSISIGTNGLRVTGDTTGKAKKEIGSGLKFGMMDLGFNILQDNTNYASAATQAYLANIPANMRNASLFDLRNIKSVNFNFYPVLYRLALVKTKGQRLYLSAGLGLQIYNFSYENHISYTRNPSSLMIDNINVRKDKLGVDYLNIPLMLTAKTRIGKDNWLVYGVGVTGGYRLATWNKQKSSTFGKQKIKDPFSFNDFNECITGEIGLEGIIRFYASYQVTSLYDNVLEQHPISFGIRFVGM